MSFFTCSITLGESWKIAIFALKVSIDINNPFLSNLSLEFLSFAKVYQLLTVSLNPRLKELSRNAEHCRYIHAYMHEWWGVASCVIRTFVPPKSHWLWELFMHIWFQEGLYKSREHRNPLTLLSKCSTAYDKERNIIVHHCKMERQTCLDSFVGENKPILLEGSSISSQSRNYPTESLWG